MLENKLEIIISSCEKYSDLWDLHLMHLNKFWGNRKIKTTIVTDCPHKAKDKDVLIFAAGEGLEMPQRLKVALLNIKTEYILITLDDYFLTKQVENEKIERLVKIMDKEGLDYIRMFPIPKEKKKMKEYEKMYWIDLNRNYGVNLYPGIWRASFLKATFREEYNAWNYEVSLTKIAREMQMKCAMSRGNEFLFMDIIRKGLILRKAAKYLNKNNFYLARKKVSINEEIKLHLMFWTKKYFPRWMQKIIKETMIKCGVKFFSEGV